MDKDPNLLVTAFEFIEHSRKHAQKEDYFTEVLATLLSLSPSFLDRFLELVSDEGNSEFSDATQWDIETREVITSRYADEGIERTGIPDLVLRGGEGSDAPASHLIAIEVKVDQRLYFSQLDKYHRWLVDERTAYESLHLAGLAPLRPGRHLDPRIEDLDFWEGVISWGEVQKGLEDCLTSQDTNGLPSDFLTYGRDFEGLLIHQNLVPPSPLSPGDDARTLRTRPPDKGRFRNIGQLLKIALESGEVWRILREHGWRPMRTASGVRYVQDLGRGFVRVRFAPDEHPGTFLFFGFAYQSRGWILRTGEEEGELDPLELLCGLEVWEEAGSDPASARLSSWVEGGGPPGGPNWKLAAALNDAVPNDMEIYVPHIHRNWARLVCRRSTVDFPADKDAQLHEMARFYGDFLAGFRTLDGTILDREESTLLDAVSGWLDA